LPPSPLVPARPVARAAPRPAAPRRPGPRAPPRPAPDRGPRGVIAQECSAWPPLSLSLSSARTACPP
ncbi:hypothetical protein, partial [Streptomyces sp. MNP-20]|uniref:hypothetical protein n=1 Tax=Streptomyces sp. MNP-20 TaxID=2721165 RepID=UPI001C1E30E9